MTVTGIPERHQYHPRTVRDVAEEGLEALAAQSLWRQTVTDIEALRPFYVAAMWRRPMHGERVVIVTWRTPIVRQV